MPTFPPSDMGTKIEGTLVGLRSPERRGLLVPTEVLSVPQTMVDWNSSQELKKEQEAFIGLIHVAAGLYLWEFLLSADVELAIITRKRTYKWPIIFYIFNRYSMLLLIILVLFGMDNTIPTGIDCLAIRTAIEVCFYLSLVLSSVNLAIRTIAIWSVDRYIMLILTILVLGEVGIIAAIRVPRGSVPGHGCNPIEIPSKLAAAMHIYPMGFDIIVFALAAWKLRIYEATSRSKLAVVFFRDGLFYIAVTLLVNIFVAVFEILNLNPLMDSIFNIPAVMAMTIAATRVVRNLQVQARKSHIRVSGPDRPITDINISDMQDNNNRLDMTIRVA
ncbi:hypothetical protein K474DRAFT_1668155 [Panus rudis PR-1116 ss-1]|nr:hypothetical protein K474DRAFT_1668155 [Panus rudis PR-1116 ss-1]